MRRFSAILCFLVTVTGIALAGSEADEGSATCSDTGERGSVRAVGRGGPGRSVTGGEPAIRPGMSTPLTSPAWLRPYH
jgi:hypothetical protein